jgi:hypothetical protein
VRVQGRAMGNCPFSENHVNVCDAEVEMESMIGEVPWGIGHRSEKFTFVSLNDSYFGFISAPPLGCSNHLYLINANA